jgi:hypothetical protein
MRRTYFTVAATDVGSVSKSTFKGEQDQKNAPNVWFSGPGKMRSFLFFLYVTMAATEVGSV